MPLSFHGHLAPATRCRPRQPAPGPVDHRDRHVHAAAGLDHRQHRAAGDGAQPGREPAADAGRGGVLRPDHGGGDPRHRLGGGPLRHAKRVHPGDRAVHRRLHRLRRLDQPGPADCRARAAGRRRRHADAGRAPGGAACLSQGAVPRSHQLRRHPGPGRPADRTHAGRLAGRGRVLALDLPHQRAGRDRRPGGGAALHPQLPRRQRPLRPRRLPAAGGGHGERVAGAGRPHRPGLGAHPAGAADGAGPGGAGGLLAARAAQPGADLRAGAVCGADLPRRPAGQPVRAHRLGRHALLAAAAAAAGTGLFAGPGRHADAGGGAGRHGRQAPGHDRHHAARLPAGADRQHAAAGRHDRGLRPHGARPAAVAAHRAAGGVRRHQLAAVHRHERRHPEGSAAAARGQRQQPDLEGADAGHEPRRDLRRRPALREEGAPATPSAEALPEA
mgnify:CR=1 FL=1